MPQKGLKTHLENLAGYTMASPGSGTGVIYQSDWDVEDKTSPAYIQHKPTIAGGSTWGTETADHYAPLTVTNGTKTVALESHTHSLDNINDGTTYKRVTQSQITYWNGKLDALTFDATPALGSTNPVTSGGLYNALSIISQSAPQVKLWQQYRHDPSQQDRRDLYFEVRHPLIAHDSVNDKAVVVLMRWSDRRSRKAHYVSGQQWTGYDTHRAGWGEANGNSPSAYVTPTYKHLLRENSDTIFIKADVVRQWILNWYICGYSTTRADMLGMTLTDFRNAATLATVPLFRFGAKNAPQPTGMTEAKWKSLTHSSALFGFAIRYENPEFLAKYNPNRGLVNTTREIQDPDDHTRRIPRYYYSEVTPFKVFCLTGLGVTRGGQPPENKYELGIKLATGW